MKVHKVNGKEFILVPQMTVERYGDLADLFDEMVDDKGGVSLDLIRDFARKKDKMTRVMSLALVYKDPAPIWRRYFFVRRKLQDLKHITLDQFVEVVISFFGLGGPLQIGFLTALAQTEELAQTPLKTLPQK